MWQAVLPLVAMLSLSLGTTTAPGTQCPTASVKTIAKRMSDGTTKMVAPKPGDKDFVQCRCKERTEQQAKSDLSTISAPALVPDVPVITGFPIFKFRQSYPEPDDSVQDMHRAPPVEPPRFA